MIYRGLIEYRLPEIVDTDMYSLPICIEQYCKVSVSNFRSVSNVQNEKHVCSWKIRDVLCYLLCIYFVIR